MSLVYIGAEIDTYTIFWGFLIGIIVQTDTDTIFWGFLVVVVGQYTPKHYSDYEGSCIRAFWLLEIGWFT